MIDSDFRFMACPDALQRVARHVERAWSRQESFTSALKISSIGLWLVSLMKLTGKIRH
jgi:hypothetical protein